jgi:hypothetical protein
MVCVPPAVAVGKESTVKTPVLVAVPKRVTTEINPVEALALSIAVIWESLSTVKEVAATPLKVTEVAPVKLVPVMITEDPELVQALIGLKLDMDWAKLSKLNRKRIKTIKREFFEFSNTKNEFILNLEYFFFIIGTLFNQTINDFVNWT